jgi:hypothetical protein
VFTVVHINRLKRAQTPVPETTTPTTVSTDSSRVQQKQKCKRNEEEDCSQEIPLRAGARIPVDDENSDDSEDIESQIANNVNSGRQSQDDPE